MGYACPVCDAEQADAEHLANHLAVTAALGREDHRDWLEEYAPDWADRGPEDLGEIVSQYAPEIETPEFESGHGHGPTFEDELARQSRGPGRGAMTSEAESVLEEARELTRQMQDSKPESGGEDADRDDGAGPDGEGGSDAGTGDGNENS
ncbi:DUF5810 domain-containing protein [Halosolutus halophilus]|uniref:DUF5810 domain-containing protein n=1 Tax=Halosolutus halophilus TaxID=1552990 RepID=UPI0022352C74|nr:DUF5810 domain-containing protein [Halosolutus halophilus]